MALTSLHVKDYCYGGNYYSLCKYHATVQRSDGKMVSVCTKLSGKGTKSYPNNGNDDNCQGYILLHYKDQGYDVDK